MYSFVLSLSSEKATTEADAVVNTLRHKYAAENIWYELYEEIKWMANYQTIESIKPHTYGGKGTGIVIQMTHNDLIEWTIVLTPNEQSCFGYIMVRTNYILMRRGLGVMVFNTTFNNISVISWRLVSLVEDTGVPGE